MLKELQNIYRALPVDDHTRRGLIESLMITANKEAETIADIVWKLRSASLTESERDALEMLTALYLKDLTRTIDVRFETLPNGDRSVKVVGWQHIPAQKGV